MSKKNSNSFKSKADKIEVPLVRLNKFIANAGACNRREADEFILQGLVTVNNKVVNAVGVKVSLEDKVELDGQRVFPGEKKFVLLNKPKDFICYLGDENEKSVLSLVKNAFETTITTLHPLNKSEKGLVVITNDLQLEKNLAVGKSKINSLFKVEIDQPMKMEDFKMFSKGIVLDEELVKPNKIAFVDDSKSLLGIDFNVNDPSVLETLLKKMGYSIKNLDRVVYDGLTKKNIARGQWRFLTKREVIQLRKNVKR